MREAVVWIGCLLASLAVGPLPCRSQTHPLTSTTRHPTGSVGWARHDRNQGADYFQPVQIRAPFGSAIAVSQEGEFDLEYPSPAQFGLRVTETYRFKVSQIPLLDGVTLYPTVEMIDRLHPPPGRKQEFPVVVELTIQELRQAAAGSLITRVIYLDDPRNPSFELSGSKHQPFFEVFPQEDPLTVADELGRPIAILRIGAKTPGRDGPSRAFMFHSPPVEDTVAFSPWSSSEYEAPLSPDAPVLCPADLYGESGYPRDEYLCDGGDGLYKSQVNGRGEILGLEPSETIARFTTVDGDQRTTTGNRVCIYAPRFAATRKLVQANQEAVIARTSTVNDPAELGYAVREQRATPATRHLELLQTERTRLTHTLEDQNQGLTFENRHAAVTNVRNVLPHANLSEVSADILETHDLVGTIEGTANAIAWSSAQAVQVVLEGAVAETQSRTRQPQAIDLYEMPPGRPCLRLIKKASTDSAQDGQLVTFTIGFTNIGDTPLQEVAILDNLLPRLVYEEGSETCSLPAGFSNEPGTEGSAILTWTLVEPLPSGERGEITFRCRAE